LLFYFHYKPHRVTSHTQFATYQEFDITTGFSTLNPLLLTATAHWLLRSATQPQSQSTSASAGGLDEDTVREALQKHTQALMSALPRELQQLTQGDAQAQLHPLHRIAKKTSQQCTFQL
jgi:hypothetical protein